MASATFVALHVFTLRHVFAFSRELARIVAVEKLYSRRPTSLEHSLPSQLHHSISSIFNHSRRALHRPVSFRKLRPLAMHASYLTTLILAGAATSALAQSSSDKMSKGPKPTIDADKGGAHPSAILSLASAVFPSVSVNPTQVRHPLDHGALHAPPRPQTTYAPTSHRKTNTRRPQSSALVHDVNAFLSTFSIPPELTATAAIDAWATAVRPSDAPAVQSSLDAIVNNGAATAGPSAAIAQVASAVSGQSYASQATAYAGAALYEITPYFDGLRTIFGSDLGTVAPTPAASVDTTSSQAIAPHPTGNFPAAGGAVALAVGVVGFAMM